MAKFERFFNIFLLVNQVKTLIQYQPITALIYLFQINQLIQPHKRVLIYPIYDVFYNILLRKCQIDEANYQNDSSCEKELWIKMQSSLNLLRWM